MGDKSVKTESILRAVLMSSPRGVPIYRLDREYKTFTSEPIPLGQLGHSSLEAYLRSIPHVACISTHNGETVVKGIADESQKHIAKLIAKQKKPKLHKSAPTRKPSSSYSSRSFTSSSRFASPTVPQRKSTVPGPRFVPPRLQKQTQRGGITDMSSLRMLVTQSVASASHIKRPSSSLQSQKTYPTSNRKVEVLSAPLGGAAKKPPGLLSINVTDSTRTVSSGVLSSSQSSSKGKKVSLSPSSEAEIYANIKELLSKRPNGVWYQRLEIEYKKMFSEELPQSILEKLPSLPHVTRVERPMPDRMLLYPLKVEKQPSQKSEPPQKINAEVYTLRPQPLPESHQSPRIVSVSHVDDLGHFFVQYKDLWDQIDALQESLQSIQNSPALKAGLPVLHTGMFCCAQFTEDDQWYRARITEVLEDKGTETAQVIYVDFGNYEHLPLARLCMLRKEHAELPMGAVLCKLDGVKPLNDVKWKPEATEKFREATADSRELKMTVVKIGEHHLHVDLCDEDNVSIASILVKDGFAARLGEVASSSSSGSLPLSPSSTSSTPSTSASIDSENTSPQKPLLRPRFMNKDLGSSRSPGKVQIPDEKFLDLFVCNILATDNICVSIYGPEYSDKLTALEQSMMVHYADPPQDKAVRPRVGDIFASYSKDVHTEGQWYRVQVTAEVEGDDVKVEFVDYGDTRMVLVSDLKMIPQRFLELPFQAFSVALNGVPKTKNPEVIENLKRHALGVLLVGEVVKRTETSILVELFNTSTEADININSILRSLVIPDDMMKPVLPKDGEVIDVYVTYVSEGGDIFVQIPGAGITRLVELMEDITDHYSKATKAAEFISNPLVGKICCAKCSEDGVWYRAVITQLLPDRQVEVQYVDYGNKECMQSTNLREPTQANEHVGSLPFQAVVCRLAGVSKESWNEDIAYKMMDVLADQATTLKVVKTGQCPLVVLNVTKDGQEVSVVDLLFEGEQEAAAQDSSDDSSSADERRPLTEQQTTKSSSSPDLLPVFSLPKDWVDITVTDVVDPNHFTFQPMEMLQSLEKLTDRMSEYYTDHKVRMSNVTTGSICAAFHPEHGQWYRAVIKAVLSPYQICVKFADYGDFGIVPSGNLQPLADEFKQQALLGLQGSLSGVIPCSTEWSDEANRRFEKLVLQKMLVAKVMLETSDSSMYSSDERRTPLFLYDTSTDQQDLEISKVLVDEGLAKFAEK